MIQNSAFNNKLTHKVIYLLVSNDKLTTWSPCNENQWCKDSSRDGGR